VILARNYKTTLCIFLYRNIQSVVDKSDFSEELLNSLMMVI